ncbi:hypothetical protein BGZ96_004371 [Linnemannia gamsii]|uniref:Uncharacterized protein n=1 Tax=Linnemannia gamsii TaxID=64522 RepID=A0ABQ7JIB7_9FUNG|nr:hypothetical protein BGZ96_004371 [Linnemannia gamsii]
MIANDSKNMTYWRKIAKLVFGALVTLGMVAVGVAIIGALGFGPGGIVAGSAATGIMSSYGGSVAAGSLCAIGQSIGAIGVSASVYVTAGIAGAMTALAGDAASSRF